MLSEIFDDIIYIIPDFLPFFWLCKQRYTSPIFFQRYLREIKKRGEDLECYNYAIRNNDPRLLSDLLDYRRTPFSSSSPNREFRHACIKVLPKKTLLFMLKDQKFTDIRKLHHLLEMYKLQDDRDLIRASILNNLEIAYLYLIHYIDDIDLLEIAQVTEAFDRKQQKMFLETYSRPFIDPLSKRHKKPYIQNLERILGYMVDLPQLWLEIGDEKKAALDKILYLTKYNHPEYHLEIRVGSQYSGDWKTLLQKRS